MKYSILLPIIVVLSFSLLRIAINQYVRFTVLHTFDLGKPSPLYTSARILCVGCTAGIGAGYVKEACTLGSQFTVVGRSEPTDVIAACPSGSVEFISADLSSMKTAQKLARSLSNRGFNLALFTVGIVQSQSVRKVTSEGLEMDLAVSFLSRFVMTSELLKNGGLHDLRMGTSVTKPRIFIMGFPGVSAY
jgi:NAD(P)-dependent dehydrogenase (short-subunit alcohol dehydrogenase family)